MKGKKPLPEGPLSIKALARVTHAAFETIKRIVDGLEPAGRDDQGNALYSLAAVSAELERRRSVYSSNKVPAGPGEVGLKEQKLAEQVRALKLANDKRSGSLIELDKVRARDAAMASRWNTVRGRIEAEWPVQFVGMKEADEARVVVRRMMTEIGKSLRDLDKGDQ